MCEVVGVTLILHCEQNIFVSFYGCLHVREFGCAEVSEVLSSSPSLPPPPASSVIDWSQF